MEDMLADRFVVGHHTGKPPVVASGKTARIRAGQSRDPVALSKERMKFRNAMYCGSLGSAALKAAALVMTALTMMVRIAGAGTVFVPNHSFESPPVPQVAPYAGPGVDDWQKTAQPTWYDPSQNNNTPWEYLIGTFFNVPFPDNFIDNCDGTQAMFLFALPEAGVFQDYDSLSGTNTTPTRAFDAKYQVGASYELTVGVLGGGGGMKPGATLLLSLYYRDAASNKVTVASTLVTHSTEAFPTNTHFVDYRARVPAVRQTDPWAGRNIGIQLLSTTGFELAGGYWDVDNVRLAETPPPAISLGTPTVTNGQFSFQVLSEPGLAFEIQAATTLFGAAGDWTRVGAFTNVTGVTTFTDTETNHSQRYYRARQL
jgi:hypothetical protein